uniref:Nik-related protein kinase n=1 Tax=Lygus hesperus TaxID=30085 RepID=A0A0A9VYA2_LYGHE
MKPHIFLLGVVYLSISPSYGIYDPCSNEGCNQKVNTAPQSYNCLPNGPSYTSTTPQNYLQPILNAQTNSPQGSRNLQSLYSIASVPGPTQNAMLNFVPDTAAAQSVFSPIQKIPAQNEPPNLVPQAKVQRQLFHFDPPAPASQSVFVANQQPLGQSSLSSFFPVQGQFPAATTRPFVGFNQQTPFQNLQVNFPPVLPLNLVPQQYPQYSFLPTASRSFYDINQPAPIHANNFVPLMPPLNERYLPPQSLQYNAQPPPSLQYNVQPPQSLQYNVQPSQSLLYNVLPPQSLQYNVQPSQSLQYNVQPPQKPENNVQPSQSLQYNVKPPERLQNNAQPPQGLQPNVQPPQTQQYNVQPLQSLQYNVQPPQKLQYNGQPPQSLQYSVQQPQSLLFNAQPPQSLQYNVLPFQSPQGKVQTRSSSRSLFDINQPVPNIQYSFLPVAQKPLPFYFEPKTLIHLHPPPAYKSSARGVSFNLPPGEDPLMVDPGAYVGVHKKPEQTFLYSGQENSSFIQWLMTLFPNFYNYQPVQ